MGWIDYHKAYDLVPHSWILKTLEIVGVSENVQKLMEESMKRWDTVLECGGHDLVSAEIKRGICQGDSLSPLLFIICLIPDKQPGKVNHT